MAKMVSANLGAATWLSFVLVVVVCNFTLAAPSSMHATGNRISSPTKKLLFEEAVRQQNSNEISTSIGSSQEHAQDNDDDDDNNAQKNAIQQTLAASNEQKQNDKKSIRVIAQQRAQYLDLMKWFEHLQRQFMQQVLRERVAEKDHLLMQKWLVDNINDLHRELKQTESDFEHYVQVTKGLMLTSEQRLKQELARATKLPLSIPIMDPQTGL